MASMPTPHFTPPCNRGILLIIITACWRLRPALRKKSRALGLEFPVWYYSAR
jgi:hypothetical protein